MFPLIITVQTRVEQDVVQFYNTFENEWQKEITINFDSSGMAIFTLDTDMNDEPYVFFGALQQVKSGSTPVTTPDTNWDFTINGKGNIITFTNDCNSIQEIGIRLTLIKRDTEQLDNAIISADPVLKNEPSAS